MLMIMLIFLFTTIINGIHSEKDVNISQTLVWGPGLQPNNIVLPARYFFIHAVDSLGSKFTTAPPSPFNIQITGDSDIGQCRTWVNQLNRKDGSYIIRYKMYYPCRNMRISIKYEGKHVAKSPYVIKDPVYNEECYCPKDISEWLQDYQCNESYDQIRTDLKPFSNVNFTLFRDRMIKQYDTPGSVSLCNYIIKQNKVYRKCYGQHIGFKMFIDANLLSLTRKVTLPDVEFFVNLGDWPLVKSVQDGDAMPYPIFSWCGSDDSFDIVMPTYDITESTLENMGRVMLDMLSVQGNIDLAWEEKVPKVFWRGRDSRRERLDLIDLARKHADLMNASLTNFFFFRNEEHIYGPKAQHVSFFKFFDYKYQLNIDGTVAAYRFPYLLAGDSLVLKQDSLYYEHFYKQLEPNKHYVPIKRDLSDLVEKVQWAIQHDQIAKRIAMDGQKFARDNLMPVDIFCYHVVLLNEWSKLLNSEVTVLDGMEHVPQPPPDPHYGTCKCHRLNENKSTQDKDEL